MAGTPGRRPAGRTAASPRPEPTRFIRPDLFSWSLEDGAASRARLFDGKLALLTNVSGITPAEAVARYKSLADIDIDQTWRLSRRKVGRTSAIRRRQVMHVGGSRAHGLEIRDRGRVSLHQLDGFAAHLDRAAA